MSSSRSKGPRGRGQGGGGKPPTLKDVAEHLKVSPTTVSVVLNRSPVADSIPEETRERVFAAARELGYRPNYMARALRQRRSYTVGVVVPRIAEGFAPAVMAGVEDHLVDEGYFYLVASHRWQPDLLEENLELLSQRSVEGLLLLNVPITHAPSLPAATVAGHRPFDNVTNVILDHDRAAELALGHLAELGHEQIAVFHGHPLTADAAVRWTSIDRISRRLGLEIRPENVGVLTTEENYREGYDLAEKLLAEGSDFTTLFAFNDISAIGAIRGFLDAGLRVPDDVSVVGFDDVLSAAFLNPSLTTVRQPLRRMGEIAAQSLLDRLGSDGDGDHESFVSVEPDFVVRGSTGPPPAVPPTRKAAAGGRAQVVVGEAAPAAAAGAAAPEADDGV